MLCCTKHILLSQEEHRRLSVGSCYCFCFIYLLNFIIYIIVLWMLSWSRQGLKVRMVKDKRRKQGRKKEKRRGAKQRKVHQQIYSFAVFVSLSLSVLVFSIECTWKMRVRVCNNAIPPKSQRQTSKETPAIHGSRELKIWGHVSWWQPSVHPGRGKREAPDGALTAKGRGVRRPEAAGSWPC